VRGLALVAVVEPDELIAMDAVEGEDDHHDAVGHEEADVEGVPAVVALEGAVGVVGPPIVREAVLVGEEERESVDVVCQGTAPPEDVGSAHFTRGFLRSRCVRCARKARFQGFADGRWGG
jgi:hypothetical protein